MGAKWDVRIVYDDRTMFKTMRMLLDASERAQALVVPGLSDPLAQVQRSLRWITSRGGGLERSSNP